MTSIATENVWTWNKARSLIELSALMRKSSVPVPSRRRSRPSLVSRVPMGPRPEVVRGAGHRAEAALARELHAVPAEGNPLNDDTLLRIMARTLA